MIIIRIIAGVIAVSLVPLVNKWLPKHTGPYADHDTFVAACDIAFICVMLGVILFVVVKVVMEKRTDKKNGDS